MIAVLSDAPGGWDHTTLAEVPEPVPGADQVLVEIRAVGLNPADAFQIEGSYPGGPKPPFVPGRDGAGVVIRGDEAGRWKPGDDVAVLQSSTTHLAEGTLCQRQRIAAENLAALPEGWSFAEAAAAPLVYQTAWKALAGLERGQCVGVTGASGGVGLAAVHLAHALGATVVAFSRSEEKRQRLLTAGADFVIPPDGNGLKNEVVAATSRKGFDLVVENVGGASLATSLHLLGVNGRISVVGLLAGVEGTISIPSLLFKRATIRGILVSEDPPPTAAESWRQIVATLREADLRPIVDSTFPLSEFRAAFDKLRRDTFGKVVVAVDAANATKP